MITRTARRRIRSASSATAAADGPRATSAAHSVRDCGSCLLQLAASESPKAGGRKQAKRQLQGPLVRLGGSARGAPTTKPCSPADSLRATHSALVFCALALSLKC